jgi:ABC-2 type transport system ATP-binding protein
MTDVPGSPAIEADALTKTYRGEITALTGLSFATAAGRVFALLGPNGAGKSTTVKILTTLTSADSGRARVARIDVAADPGRVRRIIGVVSQAHAVDLEATGRENLMLHGRLQRVARGELRSRTQELLDRFGLSDQADRLVKTYSGGMQRRLDVASALVHRPQALFLDEPTTGLDPESRAAMWAEIERLAGDEGVAVLLTTHYLDEADKLAAEVAIVDGGRIVAQGSPDELKRDLEGDALVIELSAGDEASRASEVVGGLLSEVVVDSRTLRARARSGSEALPAVLARLDAAGLRVAAATVARPSLDDVYLRHTGRSMHTPTEAIA